MALDRTKVILVSSDTWLRLVDAAEGMGYDLRSEISEVIDELFNSWLIEGVRRGEED